MTAEILHRRIKIAVLAVQFPAESNKHQWCEQIGVTE